MKNSKLINKNYIREILKPSQMDICFSEKCNLNCTYCFVDKSSEAVLSIPQVKKGIDTFFRLPGKDKTITFTTSEPFLYPEMFMEAIKHIFKQADKKSININVIATTNGVLFNEKMQNFISKLDDRFTLNFSLDGEEKSHDLHRKFSSNKENSSFEKATANFKIFLKRKNVRVITTITPETVRDLEKNVSYISKQKFINIDLFPQMLTIWKKKDLLILETKLEKIVKDFNEDKIHGDLRLLNRLWGATHYAKILLGADGNFYLFEWVLTFKSNLRSSFIIGNVDNIDMKKREALFTMLFSTIRKKTSNICDSCPRFAFCSGPLPLYLWSIYAKKNFDKYFLNFCEISKIMVDASEKIINKNKLDNYKWEKDKMFKK